MNENWLDILDDEGESPCLRLMQASVAVADALLEDLLEEQAAFATSESASIHLYASNAEVDEVRDLIDEGEDPNDLSENGLSLLDRAALNGSLDLAKLLVNRGADVNRVDTALTGLTPWGMANMMGHTDIMDFLRQYGATY